MKKNKAPLEKYNGSIYDLQLLKDNKKNFRIH